MNKLRILTGIAVLFLIIAISLPAFCPPYYLSLAVDVLIFAMFAMSLNMAFGYAGLPCFGHSAFFGLGSYAIAILSTRWLVNFWVNMMLALCITAIMASIFGVLSLRTKRHYFILITLALGQVLWGLVWRWRSFTNGDDGIRGILRPELGLQWSITSISNFYFFVLGCFVVICLLMLLILQSPFGKALIGIRENDSRMRALGYNTWLYKLTVFVLAGVFAGVAGALFAYHTGYVHPSNFSLVRSAECILMVIFGGAGTLLGPAIGAGFVVLLSNILSSYTKQWPFVLGLLYILVVLVAPQGLVGLLKQRFRL